MDIFVVKDEAMALKVLRSGENEEVRFLALIFFDTMEGRKPLQGITYQFNSPPLLPPESQIKIGAELVVRKCQFLALLLTLRRPAPNVLDNNNPFS